MTDHVHRAHLAHATRMARRLAAIREAVFGGDLQPAAAATTTLGRFWEQIAHAHQWSSSAEQDPAADALCAEFAIVGAPVLRGRLPLETRAEWLEAGIAAAPHGRKRPVFGARGELALDRRDFWQAANDFELALTAAIAEQDRQAQGQELDSLGVAFAGMGDIDAAERYHGLALEALREAGDRMGEAVALNNLARIALRDGDAYLALDRFKAASEITGGGFGPLELKGMGEGALIVGDATSAMKYFERALDGFRELGVVDGELETLRELAGATARLGDLDGAIELLDRAVATARRTAWAHEEFTLLERQVELELASGRVDDARAHVERECAVAATLGTVERRRALQSEAALTLAVGAAPRAVALLEEALQLVEGTRRMLIRRGGARLALEDFSVAPTDHIATQALRLQDLEGRRSVLIALGDAHASRGDVGTAVERYEEAHEALGGRVSRASAATSRRLGDALVDRGQAGDIERAIACYEQAVEVARNLRDRRWEADIVGEIGNAHWREGDLERAEQWYLRALAIDRETGDEHDATHVLGQLGHTYSDAGRFEEALASFTEAAEIAHRIGYGQVLITFELRAGHALHELGRHDEALARFATVVDDARRRGELEEEALALEWLYAALIEAGREAEAMGASERHEEIRRRLDAAQG